MSAKQSEQLSTARVTIFPPFPEIEPETGLRGRIDALMLWVNATRFMRTLKQWNDRRGSTLAGGMAYAGLFSAFAAILVFFSVAGIVLSNNTVLLTGIVDAIAESVPGLIGENGVVTRDTLLSLDETMSLTITGVIALVSALWTALNFLNGTRRSIRAIFDLPPKTSRNFFATKALDLALMVMFGIGVMVSVALTAASSGLTTWVLNDVLQLGLSGLTNVVIRVSSVIITLLFDALVMAVVLRLLAAIRIPWSTLWPGALIGAFMLMLLKQLGSILLGGATSNPLLATFAALLGVLIFLNFVCMVLLITASWVKVTMDDRGQAPTLLTAEEAEERTQRTEFEARRERLATDRIQVAEELNQTPRWRRRKLRRRYEAIVEEQRDLEHEALTLRLGYDPIAAHANRRESAD